MTNTKLFVHNYQHYIGRENDEVLKLENIVLWKCFTGQVTSVFKNIAFIMRKLNYPEILKQNISIHQVECKKKGTAFGKISAGQ